MVRGRKCHECKADSKWNSCHYWVMYSGEPIQADGGIICSKIYHQTCLLHFQKIESSLHAFGFMNVNLDVTHLTWKSKEGSLPDAENILLFAWKLSHRVGNSVSLLFISRFDKNQSSYIKTVTSNSATDFSECRRSGCDEAKRTIISSYQGIQNFSVLSEF